MKNNITPYEWRQKHPRCEFCQYLRLDTTATRLNLPCSDYYECSVKNKIIHHIKMPRPWCKCFVVKKVQIFEEELCDATNDSMESI